MRQGREEDRITRRSSSGMRRDEREYEPREGIRHPFDERDDGRYPAPRYDGRERYDDYDRREEYDRRDGYDRRDRDERYDRRDERYPAPRDERAPRARDDRYDTKEKKPAPRKTAGGKRRRTGGDTERLSHQVIPYVMFWMGLFSAVSFVLRDLVGLEGSTGTFGSWFANFLCGLFGPGAYVLPLFLVVLSLRWKKFVRGGILARKLLLSASFVALLSGIIHVFLEDKTMRGILDTDGVLLYQNGVLRTGGGFFGGFLGEWIGYVVRLWGTWLLAIPLLLVIGIYLVGMTPSGLWQRISGKFKIMSENRKRRDEQRYDGKEGEKKRPEEPKALPEPEEEPEPMRYDFREEEDEILSRPAKKETVVESGNDLVDIPDDEIVTEIEAAPEVAAAPTQKPDDVSIVLGEFGTKRNFEEELDEILYGLGKEKEAPAKAATTEQKTYQGNYFSPFSLPVRPEPKEGLAHQYAAERQAAEAASEAAKVEEPVAAPAPQIEPQPTVDLEPAFEPVREEAPVTADPLDELLRGWEPKQEAPVAAERSHLGEPEPIIPEEPAPAPVKEPLRDFGFDLANDTEDGIPEEPPQPTFTPAPTPPVVPTAPAHHAAPVQRPVAPVTAPAPEPEKPVQPPREYRYPPMVLLNEDKSVKDDDHEEEDREKIEILRRTLESFNVHIKDEVTCSRGPTVTRYELCPEIGVSVRAVINRADDISLYMSGANVRIAPIPGKTAIGIEVPNTKRETVYMRTLLEAEAFKKSKKPLEVPLGMGIGGEVQMCDLSAMPHLLVAGTTGSGKSVCINAILISLMYKTSPRDLRLILVDPKRVEFKVYQDLPHLYAPIITEAPRAIGALACAVQEMERRYSLMEDVGVRSMDDYNRITENDPDREHLPRLVIIIDEFYDLKMACTNNDVENYCCRLAQKARAAGIHLIIGTQRPSVNVITGTLKANIPSRIAFTVNQQVDSRTILDAPGAELLTGRGDMLYSPVGGKPTRWQGPFVSDDEVAAVVEYVRTRNDPVQYNQAFMDQIEMEMARAANNGKKRDELEDYGDDESGDEDPKFVEAVELAIQTQKVATSLLQRRLGVGYGRAAKIIDRMEELGLVTPSEGGNKPRKLLPAAQGYLDHLANMEEGEDDMGDGPDGFTEDY